MHVLLQIESKVDFLLCSKFIVVLFLLPLFINVHLFVNLLLCTPMITTLMWLVSIVVTINLMWFESNLVVATLMFDQSDLLIVLQLCVPKF
jgi:hypothetical protein